MDKTLLAVIRSCRPEFRSRYDKLAFAVHAFVISQGYKVVGVGHAAESNVQDLSESIEEVDVAGWTELPNAYAFLYQDVEGKRTPLHVKCLVVGHSLLVHWAVEGQATEPKSASLFKEDFTTDAKNIPDSFVNLQKLAVVLNELFKATAQPSPQQSLTVSCRHREHARSNHAAPKDDSAAGPESFQYSCMHTPTGVGMEDVVPQGLRPPGFGAGPGQSGLMQGGPSHGGGMLVGPGHPMFGQGGRAGGTQGTPGWGSVPAGARYDPINPPGLPGFHPNDFVQPDQQRLHPDVMQLGRDRGADFDEMFG